MSGELTEEELKQALREMGFDPAVFLKCSDCANFEAIKDLNRRVTEEENQTKIFKKRLLEGDKRFDRMERELEQNSRTTDENNEMLKKIHDGLFIDNGEHKSTQTKLATLTDRQGHIWAFMVFIIISIAGLAFYIIQKSIEPEERQAAAYPALPYNREPIKFIDKPAPTK